jgi:hypothetical protein
MSTIIFSYHGKSVSFTVGIAAFATIDGWTILNQIFKCLQHLLILDVNLKVSIKRIVCKVSPTDSGATLPLLIPDIKPYYQGIAIVLCRQLNLSRRF